MKISLDISVIDNFRDAVNDNPALFFEHKIYKKYWNTICSCMSRIEDIAQYLNNKRLGASVNYRCAFDFIEFISQAAVLIDCVDHLSFIITDTHIESIKHSTFFKHKVMSEDYEVNSETDEKLDKRYFEYIRSLSSLHPANTGHFKNEFQRFQSEVSPFITWSCFMPKKRGDLSLMFYDNGEVSEFNSIPLFIDEFFKYIQWVYSQLDRLTDGWKSLISNIIIGYSNKLIRLPSSFRDYDEYLENLSKEARLRACDGIEDLIDDSRILLNIKHACLPNARSCEELKVQIKRGISQVHNILQNMDYDAIEHKNLILDFVLHARISEKDTGPQGNYYFEKVPELVYHGSPEYARICIRLLVPFLNKYVALSNDDFDMLSDEELYLTVKTARYLYAKEQRYGHV